MDKLVLERSQPVQGQPVDVTVRWNGECVGEMLLPFKAWLKFKKLLEKGLEMDAREDHALDIKLTVRGAEIVAKGEPYPNKYGTVIPKRTIDEEIDRLPVEELDAADLAAIAAAEAGAMPATNPVPEVNTEEVKQGSIRSLRRENADG